MSEVALARAYISKAQQAADRGIPFELTVAQFKQLKSRKTCWYTGVVMTKAGQGALRPTDRTLDRIDASIGYTKDNTVACCHSVNKLKSVLEETDIISINDAREVLTRMEERGIR